MTPAPNEDELFGPQIDAAIERFLSQSTSGGETEDAAQESDAPDESLQAEAMDVAEEAQADGEAELEVDDSAPDAELTQAAGEFAQESLEAEQDDTADIDLSLEGIDQSSSEVEVTEEDAGFPEEDDQHSEIEAWFNSLTPAGDEADDVRELVDEQIDMNSRRRQM